MAFLDVRRLAATDMWGIAGTRRRRQLIRAEFAVGAAGCIVLGVLSLVQGSGWASVLGFWLVGVGLNYIPLSVQATALSKPGVLEEEVRGCDVRRELRRAGVRQLWIAVPFAVVVAALLDAYSRMPG